MMQILPVRSSRYDPRIPYRHVGRGIFGAGVLVTATDAQWTYVSVRRMTMFLEQTLCASLSWVVFEPNGPLLWRAITLNVEAFLLSVFRQGMLQGTTPAQAFSVACGAQTITQTDIDNGVVNCVVGVALMYPAEFVVIAISQKTGG